MSEKSKARAVQREFGVLYTQALAFVRSHMSQILEVANKRACSQSEAAVEVWRREAKNG